MAQKYRKHDVRGRIQQAFDYLCRRMPSIAFHTLGCKLNFSETSTLARQFSEAGWTKTDFFAPADVYLINTCSVTENADRECRQIVHRAIHHNPEATVIVVGCYAQLKPDAVADIPGVSLVLGASQKFDVLKYLDQQKLQQAQLVMACEIDTVSEFIPSHSSGDRTRVFLKVQDGCDYSCTFCTIPMARGKSRSDSIDNVIKRALKVKDQGAREIVFTGVNLGDFGIRDNSGRHQDRFTDLAYALENHPGLEGMRFRISSIEPNLITDELISLVAGSHRFMPHFHIPMQSGSDNILKAMRRRYLTGLYASKIERIRAFIPQAGIGADVITGFPGESDNEFRETLDFIRTLGLTYLHAFTYSERENTPAADLKNIVPVSIRKERTRMLRSLSDKLHRNFCLSQAGMSETVLFENENRDGNMHGYTRNYIRVSAPWDENLLNQPVTVRLEHLQPEGWMSATILSTSPVFA